MTAPNLIPPEPRRPTLRQALLAAVYGALAGNVLGLVGWLATGGVSWFYAVPIGAILGVVVRFERPNVLWGHRAR